MAPLTRTNMALAVPTETTTEVVADVYGQSAVLNLADVRPMTTAVEEFIVSGAFNWPAGMSNVAEGAAKPTVDGGLASYQIVANKMAVFVIVTDELLADSPVDIIGYYRDAISQQMAKLIDRHGIHGGGPFGTESLVDAATAAGGAHVVTEGTDPSADFSKLLTAVENEDLAPSGFLAARRKKSELRDLRDADNRPLYIDSLTSDTPDQIFGEPIYYLGRGMFGNAAAVGGTTPSPGDVQVVSGDFSQYLIGMREDLQFSLHNEGTVAGINLLETNQTALRAEMRLGAKVITNKAFSILRNS